MPGQMQMPLWVEEGGPASELSTAAGSGGSAGHPCYQNPECPDRIEEQKIEPHIARLRELWTTPQLQTVHIPKSMNAPFLKHPEFTTGQKRYLCSITKIYNTDSLKTLMKRQYMHMIQHDTQKPGISTHHRSQISPRYSQKQHSPCTTWRHQLERLDSLHSSIIATPSTETQAIQHSLWQPGRNKEGLKCGPLPKARCKSLKIFPRPIKAFRYPAFTNDCDSCMSEEKRDEDLLNKCMQSMSIEEQGENLM